MLWSSLYPSQKHLAWLLCSGIIHGRLAAARAPFTCIRPIPLSCALRNSAFGLQVRVISRQYTVLYYYTFKNNLFTTVLKLTLDRFLSHKVLSHTVFLPQIDTKRKKIIIFFSRRESSKVHMHVFFVSMQLR